MVSKITLFLIIIYLGNGSFLMVGFPVFRFASSAPLAVLLNREGRKGRKAENPVLYHSVPCSFVVCHYKDYQNLINIPVLNVLPLKKEKSENT